MLLLLINWNSHDAYQDFIAIDCPFDAIPSIGTHYDFINRLWIADPSIENRKPKKLYSFNKKPSSKSVSGKNKKLPNKSQCIVKKICAFFLNSRSFNKLFELLLQTIFSSLSVKQSVDFELINPEEHTHLPVYLPYIC